LSGRSGSECPGVAMKYDLHKNIGYADVCTEFEMLEIKVPIIFFGTQGWTLVDFF
jgi:hypothetical protein